MRAAALLLLAIGLWATAALPEHITALLFLALCMVLAIAPANVVFSGFESGTVWLVLGGLVVLSQLGVNITPLIAGFSVLGLAVSFGSQSLVRDIVSGMFFLAEDSFRVGEYIDGTKVKVQIPKGCQHGHRFRLKSKGMSVLRSTARGDMFLEAAIEVPVSTP